MARKAFFNGARFIRDYPETVPDGIHPEATETDFLPDSFDYDTFAANGDPERDPRDDYTTEQLDAARAGDVRRKDADTRLTEFAAYTFTEAEQFVDNNSSDIAGIRKCLKLLFKVQLAVLKRFWVQ